MTLVWRSIDSPLGAAMLVASEKGLVRLSFDETGSDLAKLFAGETLSDRPTPEQAQWFDDARAVLHDPSSTRAIPLDLRGTDFQRSVWAYLRSIPSGETRTYRDIAEALGSPGATRAVGSANGANPVSVLVPCHRVIRADGGLGGYAYGLERKRKLLEAEGAVPPTLAL